MEPDLLEESTNNYLAGLCLHNGHAGLSVVDMTTGEFLAAEIADDAFRILTDELVRMAPAEAIVSREEDELVANLRRRFDGMAFTSRDPDEFDLDRSRDVLMDQFGLGTLKGLELQDAPAALAAAGAVLRYIRETQRDGIPHLRLPRRYSPASFVVLDGNTQRNLELVESLAEKSRRGTLLSVLDHTRTSMGGRKIRQWILHPLVDIEEIRARHDAVEELLLDVEGRLSLRETFARGGRPRASHGADHGPLRQWPRCAGPRPIPRANAEDPGRPSGLPIDSPSNDPREPR